MGFSNLGLLMTNSGQLEKELNVQVMETNRVVILFDEYRHFRKNLKERIYKGGIKPMLTLEQKLYRKRQKQNNKFK